MDLTNLVCRCQAGDEEAFAALFHQYKNLIYRTAYLILDNAEEAEDVLQEAFLQVYRSLSTFQPSKGAFTTWLYRITVNCCLSRRRKPHLSVIPLDDMPSASLAGPQSSQDSLEMEEAVRLALRRLSKKLRAVVILRYYLELPYAEIAQVLDIPMGTVKSRLDLALKALRRELEALPEDLPVLCVISQREVAK